MSPAMTTWTGERVELLRKRWSDGTSSREIAAEIGDVTRNAVIGKADRLGLPDHPNRCIAFDRILQLMELSHSKVEIALRTGFSLAAIDRAILKKRQSLQAKKARDQRYRQQQQRVRILAQTQPLQPLNIPFKKLRRHSCRYITGGTGFEAVYCGRRLVRGAYCAFHANLSYQSPRVSGVAANRGSGLPRASASGA